MTIQGPGANLLTISGGYAVEVFEVNFRTVSISGLTIADGIAEELGGGILNMGGTLTVSDSTISGNIAASGGGIFNNDGTLTVTNSTVSGNYAPSGGGILNDGTLMVSNSTISGNSANDSGGGGIYNGGELTVINSTISGNSTIGGGEGGGIYSGGTLTVSNSIFSGDTATGGGGIFNNGGTLTVSASVLASTDTCSGSGCPINGSNGNVVGVSSVNLLPLGNFGGPTQTMLPLPGSPAICAGSDALVPVGVTTDQRGFPLIASCVDAGAVQSNYQTVTTANDVTDPSPDCTSGTGSTCSLRDAMNIVNSAGHADIVLAPGLDGRTIKLSSTLPVITGQMSLVGPGANNLTVSGANSTGVGTIFTVTSVAYLYGLTVANGNAGGGTGGGIFNVGTLTVSNSTISGNSAAEGGGIFNVGTLTVSNSTISGNSATEGGGIYHSGGALTVANSTISGDNATLFGGGIFSGGTLTVANSTISGNSVSVTGGGGILNEGTLTVSNSIVAGNSVTGPTGTYADIDGSYTDNGGNQASGSSSPTSTITIKLAPLGKYGGPTQTMVPLPGSPAICTGLAANIATGVTTDQRGYPNTNTTYTGYSSGSPCVDSGAVQSQYTAVQFVQQPTNTLVNTAISPSPTVEVLETNTNQSMNNTDAVKGIPLTLSYSGGPSEISGTLTETTTSGVATFGGLAPKTVGTGFTLSTSVTVVSETTLTATSNPFNVDNLATLTTPAPGSTLGTTDVTFTWGGGVGVTAYEFFLGTAKQTDNLYYSGKTTATTVTVPSIPGNLATVYAELCSEIGGIWKCDPNYTYKEGGTPAVIETPAQGSTLGTTNVTFTWSAGIGATAYELFLGTAKQTDNLYYSGKTTATTVTVPSIPGDLATVYVELCSLIGGIWKCDPNYTYKEGGTPAVMQTPTQGSTLGTTNVTFTWSAGVGVTEYELRLGTTGVGSYNLYNSGDTTAKTVTVPSIPANGVKVYARLFSKLNGNWTYLDYTYAEQ